MSCRVELLCFVLERPLRLRAFTSLLWSATHAPSCVKQKKNFLTLFFRRRIIRLKKWEKQELMLRLKHASAGYDFTAKL
jgi:hypothetical protein